MAEIEEEVDELREKGNLLFRGGKYEKALEIYEDALELSQNPVNRAILQGNISQTLFQLGNYQESYTQARAALDSGCCKDPVKVEYRAMMCG